MQKRTVKSLVVTLLAGVMLALAMTSCGVTLKPGDKGLYDKKNNVSYSHASTVYEAKALVKEYGKLAVTKKESYRLYTIPGTDATKMLATEDFNILYASDVSMPTLLEMIPSCLHICSDTKTVHELARIDDAAEVYALAHAYEKNESGIKPNSFSNNSTVILPDLSLLLKISGNIGNKRFDQFLDRHRIFADFPLGMITVPQLKEVKQIGKIHRSPECNHHILRQHSPCLLTANTSGQQFLIQCQACLIVLCNQSGQSSSIKIRITE